MSNNDNASLDFIHMSETDVAHHILVKAGTSMYYKELVLDVIKKKCKPVQSLAQAISEVYTVINMDSRFHYEGNGQWGLTEWNPPETKRSTRSSSKASSSSASNKASHRREKLFEGIQE